MRSGMKAMVLALALPLTLAASPALAQSGAPTTEMEQALVAQLQALGFDEVVVSHTLLGRLRIDARQGALRREIVVNPKTGEILRDWQGQDVMVASGGGSDHGASAVGAGVTATATREGSVADTSVPDIVDRSLGVAGQ